MASQAFESEIDSALRGAVALRRITKSLQAHKHTGTEAQAHAHGNWNLWPRRLVEGGGCAVEVGTVAQAAMHVSTMFVSFLFHPARILTDGFFTSFA